MIISTTNGNLEMEKLFLQQDEYIQTFLLSTSILGEVCGPLCDAVLHPEFTGPGQIVLEYCSSINLLITPLDTENKWFSFDPLSKAFLRNFRMKASHLQLINYTVVLEREYQWYIRSENRKLINV